MIQIDHRAVNRLKGKSCYPCKVSLIFEKVPVSDPNLNHIFAVDSMYRLGDVATKWCQHKNKISEAQLGFYPITNTMVPGIRWLQGPLPVLCALNHAPVHLYVQIQLPDNKAVDCGLQVVISVAVHHGD